MFVCRFNKGKRQIIIYRDIKSIHSSGADDGFDKFYFLNDLPNDLIGARTVSDNRYLCDEEYSGEQVNIENEFNFD